MRPKPLKVFKYHCVILKGGDFDYRSFWRLGAIKETLHYPLWRGIKLIETHVYRYTETDTKGVSWYVFESIDR